MSRGNQFPDPLSGSHSASSPPTKRAAAPDFPLSQPRMANLNLILLHNLNPTPFNSRPLASRPPLQVDSLHLHQSFTLSPQSARHTHHNGFRHPQRKTVRLFSSPPLPPLPFQSLDSNQITNLTHTPRIRRADLYSRPSSSPSPSPAPEESTLLHSRLAELYGPIPIPTSNPLSSPSPQNPTQEPTQKQEQEQEQDGEGEGFEFRLFSTPHSSLKTQKILLQQPEDLEVGGGFVRRERDKSFYIAPPLTGEARARIEAMCVSGEEVLKWARGGIGGWRFLGGFL
jgi:hypothetical protein